MFLLLIYCFICRLIDVDDFIAKLWDIHLSVRREGYIQVIPAPTLPLIV
jgi:hypothetical protein